MNAIRSNGQSVVMTTYRGHKVAGGVVGTTHRCRIAAQG